MPLDFRRRLLLCTQWYSGAALYAARRRRRRRGQKKRHARAARFARVYSDLSFERDEARSFCSQAMLDCCGK